MPILFPKESLAVFMAVMKAPSYIAVWQYSQIACFAIVVGLL
jgi:hypothetical protein